MLKWYRRVLTAAVMAIVLLAATHTPAPQPGFHQRTGIPASITLLTNSTTSEAPAYQAPDKAVLVSWAEHN